MAAIEEGMVPLTKKAGYPGRKVGGEMVERVKKRLGVGSKEEIIREWRVKACFMMSNPNLWEMHMQIISDALISKNGEIGTVRGATDP